MSQTELLDEIGRLSVFQQLELIKNAVRLLEEHLRDVVNPDPNIDATVSRYAEKTIEAKQSNDVSNASILDLAGIFEAPVSDIAEKHDEYIGEALANSNE